MQKDNYVKKHELVNHAIGEKASRLYQLVIPLLLLVAMANTSFAQISGTVYRDFNEDGVRSYTAPSVGELGVGGVLINVYNSAGTLVGTATSSSAAASEGTFSANVTGAGPFRVEFVNLPTGYFDGVHGAASGTSVQFVAGSPATDVDLGINYPSDYCQPTPNFLVPCYVNGDSEAGATGSAGAQGVLVTLPYNSTGNTPAESAIALNSAIGTVYGVAYQRQAKIVFTSAFVKRHSGLGTAGAGAIYVTEAGSGATYTSSLFTTLPTAVTAVTPFGNTIVGSNGSRGLPAATTTQNYDVTTFDQVGKAGLGDLEISDDGRELFVVNLGDRKLYKIQIVNPTTTNPTAGTIASYSLPAIVQTTGSVFRPFALKYYRGQVYIGGVTTNENVSGTVNFGTGSTTSMITRDTSGMKGIVFAFNPATTSFTPVLSFPLTYQKGASGNDQTGVSRADRWFPWTNIQPTVPATATVPNRYARNDAGGNSINSSYPQPILAGIEFDVDGDMILSIRDRFGDQYGNNNFGTNTSSSQLYRAIAPGDILRAGKCNPATNLWTIENNASVCGGTATAGANNDQGFGGGEYYFSDAIAIPNNTNPYHEEMSEGGLALLPGRDEVASVVLDPTTNVDAGGIRRFKNSDGSGSPSTSVQIYASTDVATYGKANGLGDLELNCDLPPIQIGNRVFRDSNNNGIQDPGEPGLAGVQVVLRGPGSTTIATATTNANGEYYFSTAVGTSTTSSINNLTLTSGGSYTLSFPTSVSAFAISAFPNAATGANADAIDSDPTAAGIVAFTLGQAGQNNFAYDAGYACVPLALSLMSVTVCAGQPVSLSATSGFSSYTFSSGLTQVGTSNVATIASATASDTYSVTALNADGCSGTASGTVTVNQIPVITLSSAAICAGQSATLTATSGFASYTFSPGLTRIGTSNLATGTAAGTYSVTAASAAGCIGISSGTGLGTITVSPVPALSLNSATICAGQTATLTASGTSFASYVFSSGLTQVGTGNTATGTIAGVYSVTAISTAGCSATATGALTVNPAVVVSISSATICAGQTGVLTATVGYDQYIFSSGSTQIGNSNVATSLVGGTYSVTAISSAGCSATATGSITINPVVALTLTSATICAGQSTTLTVGGCAGGTINWSTAQGTASIVVSPALTAVYSATCTLTTGCSSTISTTVKVNPSPSYTAAPQALTATCTGAVASNDARINLTTLQNTERADVVLGSTYGSGPAYGAPTNLPVTAGVISFTNLPNPGASQPYTVRLYSAGGTCYTDVTVILEPTYCNCPAQKCVPLLIQKTRSSLRTASR